MGKTSIEWVRGDDGSDGYTVNPIRARNRATGAVGHFCEKVSPGCKFCYASEWNERVRPQPNGRPAIGTGLAFIADNRDQVEMWFDVTKLQDVLRIKTPARIFWCDMTDLFGDWVPDAWIDQVIAVAALTPQHTHILVTKRARRAREYFNAQTRRAEVSGALAASMSGGPQSIRDRMRHRAVGVWPLPNVWLLVSVEDQQRADERIPELLQTSVAVRGLSLEPLLGEVNLGYYVAEEAPQAYRTLSRFYGPEGFDPSGSQPEKTLKVKDEQGLHWLIVGGGSGRGKKVQQTIVRHVRLIVRQGKAAGIPTFVKQLGSFVMDRNDAEFDGSRSTAWPEAIEQRDAVEEHPNGYREDYQGAPVRIRLRDRKGGDPTEWPRDIRVRQFPQVKR